MEVYLELLLLDNLVMNLAILCLARRLLSDDKAMGWVWWAAALGTLYAVIMPLVSFLESLPCKVLLACAMVLLAFRLRSVKRFFHCLLVFLGCTFLAIGAAVGIFYLSGSSMMTEGGAFYSGSAAARSALYGLCALALAGRWLFLWLQRRHVNKHTLVRLEIAANGQEVALTALLDSGNMLTEKRSGLPVAVVQRSSIQRILPDFLKNTYTGSESTAPGEVVLIPYRSLGKRQGALLGFIPGGVRVVWEDKTYPCACAIGVCEEPLSGDGAYEAIIHPLMLKEAEI